MLPVIGVTELFILFWRNRSPSEPPPLPSVSSSPIDNYLPWRPTIMFITAVIGGLVYVIPMALLEPDGMNPFTLVSGQVDRMTLLPDHYASLVDSDVDLTREEIQLVCHTLQSAAPITPNHPGSKWRCQLRVIDKNGDVLTVVLSESGKPSNGFLVWWWSPNMRLNKGTHRCDALAPVIKAVVESRNAEQGAAEQPPPAPTQK
jgi:hypothetical protein